MTKTRQPKELTLTINEASLNEAIEDYVNSMGIDTQDKSVAINITVGRGANPTNATITLSEVAAGEKPVTKAVKEEDEPVETKPTSGNRKSTAKKPAKEEPVEEPASEEKAEEDKPKNGPEPEAEKEADDKPAKRTAGSLFD